MSKAIELAKDMPVQKHRRFMVKCVETGEVKRGRKWALLLASKVDTTKMRAYYALRQACRSGHKAFGLTWERVG